MTNFENIKSMSSKDLANFLDIYCFEDTPWQKWWDNKYCKNCEGIPCKVQLEGYEHDCEAAYCELNKECKFFQGREMPTTEEICEMWLNENNSVNIEDKS